MANVGNLEKRKGNAFDLFCSFYISPEGFDLSVPIKGFSAFSKHIGT